MVPKLSSIVSTMSQNSHILSLNFRVLIWFTYRHSLKKLFLDLYMGFHVKFSFTVNFIKFKNLSKRIIFKSFALDVKYTISKPWHAGMLPNSNRKLPPTASSSLLPNCSGGTSCGASANTKSIFLKPFLNDPNFARKMAPDW